MTARQPRDTTPTCPLCGWVGKTTTAGLARNALERRHRCSREQLRRTVAARAAARKTADGPRRSCRHKIAHHVHATRAAYVLDRCRCRACRDANSAIERDIARAQAYGRWAPYVDAQPARDHLAALMAAGVGLKRIVIVSGVSQGCLWKLVYGKRRADGAQHPSKRIRPATEAALLAVVADMDTLAGGARIDPTGTARRLQALVVMGWSQSKLAIRLGIEPSNFTPIIGGRRQVTVAHARAVRALYERLAEVPPPEGNHRDKIAASRARNHARAEGWLAPAWWDADAIDDPAVRQIAFLDEHVSIDEVNVDRLTHGERVPDATRDERLDAVRVLTEQGLSSQQIRQRLGVTGRTVVRDRHDLEAVAAVT